MMRFLTLCAWLAVHVPSTVHAQPTPKPIFSATAVGSEVLGRFIIFLAEPNKLAYAGFGQSLTTPAACTGGGGNACTFRVSTGDCTAPGTQLLEQPFETNVPPARGTLEGIEVISQSLNSLAGLPVEVLDAGGARLACSDLMEVESATTGESDVYTVEAGEVGGSGVTGEVTLYVIGNEICFYGTAAGFGGPQTCNGNGCGTAIHEGESCDSPQGRYFAITPNVPTDPWEGIGYSSTQGTQPAEFVHCVVTGILTPGGVEFPFLISDPNDNTVACGQMAQDIAPSAPPTIPPTATPTTASPTATFAPTSSTQSPTSSTQSPTPAGGPPSSGGGSFTMHSYSRMWCFMLGMVVVLATHGVFESS